MTKDSKVVDRIGWVDVCKGICIVLVVYGHVSGGLGVEGTVGANSFWMNLRAWVYLFHMPAFFALSGYFASKLSKLSAWHFLLGRLRTICFPYLVWTIIIVAAQFAMAKFVNNPVDVSKALRFLVEPYGYGLWFLYALFLISTIFYLLRGWIASDVILIGLAVLLFFLAARNVFGFWPILNAAMTNFIFYAAAACAQQKKLSLIASASPNKKLAGGFMVLLVMTVMFFEGWTQSSLMTLIAAGLGIAGVMLLSQGLGGSALARCWAFLGVYSLEIYLGHPLWGTLSRVILLHEKISSETCLILGGVVIGVAGSLAVGIICRVCDFPYLFRWPAKKTVNG